MSAIGGPKTVTNGLISSVDFGNPKSFKGVPTKNYWTTERPNFSNWNSQDVVTADISTTIRRLHSTSNVAFSAIQYTAANYSADADANIQLSYALDVRGQGSAGLTIHQAQTSPNQSANLELSSTKLVLKENEWVRLQFEGFYHANTTTAQNCLVTLTAGTGNYVECRNAQVEFSPYTTPYVYGTRSNTQSLYDQVTSIPTTVNSITTLADNRVEFDQTNYVSLGDFSSITSKFSAEFWLNPYYLDVDANNNYRRVLFNTGNSNFILIEQSGSISFRVPGIDEVNYTAAGVTINNWWHVVCVYDQDKRYIYINGALKGSQTIGAGTVSLATLRLNQTGIQGFEGQIEIAKIYNRDLTADDVLQNFEAYKGRFGL